MKFTTSNDSDRSGFRFRLQAGETEERIRRQGLWIVGEHDWQRQSEMAFTEAAVGFLRNNPVGQAYLARLEKKHGKAKALTALAHKLACVYPMLQRQEAFDMKRFFNH
jgi:hypothetical protein